MGAPSVEKLAQVLDKKKLKSQISGLPALPRKSTDVPLFLRSASTMLLVDLLAYDFD